jgi:transposase-like protein
MTRFYKNCPTCRQTRMQLIGKSSECIGSPPFAVERYYQCPRCGGQWTYDVNHNFLLPGVPPSFGHVILRPA